MASVEQITKSCNVFKKILVKNPKQTIMYLLPSGYTSENRTSLISGLLINYFAKIRLSSGSRIWLMIYCDVFSSCWLFNAIYIPLLYCSNFVGHTQSYIYSSFGVLSVLVLLKFVALISRLPRVLTSSKSFHFA